MTGRNSLHAGALIDYCRKHID